MSMEKMPAVQTFKPGDKVRVTYGFGWDGEGVINPISGNGVYVVDYNDGRSGGFPAEDLTLLHSPKFKVGDSVKVIYGWGWDGEANIVRVFSDDGIVYEVRYKNGRVGGFRDKHLTLISSKHMSPRLMAFQAAKEIAINLAKVKGQVNMDQVQDALFRAGYSSTQLGNAAGVLFRGKNWKKVGTVKSTRKGNHSREISNWEYVR